MLIHAQYQKEREKQCKITANDTEIKSKTNDDENDNEIEAKKSTEDQNGDCEKSNDDDEADIEMAAIDNALSASTKPSDSAKMEIDSSDENNKNVDEKESPSIEDKSNESTQNDDNKETDETVRDENDSSQQPITIEENVSKNDPYSSEISIDPRTYCKLGHFHLLLEDYTKGAFIDKEK